MKKFFLLAYLILISIVAFTQKVSITRFNRNDIVVGLTNSLRVSISNCDPKSIIIKTDNGSLFLENGICFTIPKRLGETHFTIFQKKNGKQKKIKIITFNAVDLEEPTLLIGGKTSGIIPKRSLINMPFILAFIGECSEASPQIIIDSFTTCIFRKDTCFYKEVKNIGTRFSEETLIALSNTKTGDQIIFKSIHAKLASGTPSILMPLIFEITDKEENTNSN